MKRLTNRQKLKLIDGLCLLYHDSAKDHSAAVKALDNIYRVAHPHNGCPHETWDNATVRLAKRMKKSGIVDVFEEETTKPTQTVITFDKSALKDMCAMLDVPYDDNIIAFTKNGPATNILDLL